MVRTVVDSDTQTCTVTTEHTLLDDTSNEGEVLDAYLDLSEAVAGDVFEIRLYAKLLSGGDLARVYYARYVGVQDDEANFRSPIIYVPAMTECEEWKLTLEQAEGTSRDVDWTVYK